jgi:hypothetical protein
VTPEEAPIPTGSPHGSAEGDPYRSITAPFDDDPQLAELMAAAEREADIPLAAFAAVAAVIAYFYRLDAAARSAAGGQRDASL